MEEAIRSPSAKPRDVERCRTWSPDRVGSGWEGGGEDDDDDDDEDNDEDHFQVEKKTFISF